MEGLVSCIIPTYNRLPFLKLSLQSLWMQTYTHFEVIIVDDASEDGTADYCEQLEKNSRRVKYVRLSRNSGCVSVPRCIGISYAQGEFIAHIDDDVLSLNCKLELLVQGLRQNPDTLLAYGKRKIAGAAVSNGTVRLTEPQDENYNIPCWNPAKEYGVDGGQYIYRSAVYQKMPFVLCKNACDWRTAQQIAMLNGKFLYIPEDVCIYLIHANNRSTELDLDQIIIDEWLVKRHFYAGSRFKTRFAYS